MEGYGRCSGFLQAEKSEARDRFPLFQLIYANLLGCSLAPLLTCAQSESTWFFGEPNQAQRGGSLLVESLLPTSKISGSSFGSGEDLHMIADLSPLGSYSTLLCLLRLQVSTPTCYTPADSHGTQTAFVWNSSSFGRPLMLDPMLTCSGVTLSCPTQTCQRLRYLNSSHNHTCMVDPCTEYQAGQVRLNLRTRYQHPQKPICSWLLPEPNQPFAGS